MALRRRSGIGRWARRSARRYLTRSPDDQPAGARTPDVVTDRVAISVAAPAALHASPVRENAAKKHAAKTSPAPVGSTTSTVRAANVRRCPCHKTVAPSLPCVTTSGFCGWAHASTSRRSPSTSSRLTTTIEAAATISRAFGQAQRRTSAPAREPSAASRPFHLRIHPCGVNPRREPRKACTSERSISPATGARCTTRAARHSCGTSAKVSGQANAWSV